MTDQPGDERTLCPQCGIGVKIDEDGCCVLCGATACTVGDVATMLRGQGMYFVSAKEKSAYELFIPQDWAVLHAMQDVSQEALDNPPPEWRGLAAADRPPEGKTKMSIDDRLERILSSLDALLQGGHIEAARLIISEVRHRRLEDPGVDPLSVVDDETFEALSKRIQEEAFRRERLHHPHVGEL